MSYPYVYTFRRCPYAMRARMALVYSGVNFEIREILLKNKPPQMLSLSPKGTVPVFVLADGSILDESLDIMRWAMTQNDPDGWLELSAKQHVSLNALVLRNDDEFKFFIDRYKYANRFPERTKQNWREGCMPFLTQLEDNLALHKHLLRSTLSFADIAIFPFVRQFAHVDLEWFQHAGFPRVFEWHQKNLHSEIFISVMKKYPLWQEGNTPILFND